MDTQEEVITADALSVTRLNEHRLFALSGESKEGASVDLNVQRK